jgi:hypothetical protein
VTDARLTQQCYILHLECGHNHRLMEIDLLSSPRLMSLAPGDPFLCPGCQEETPAERAEREQAAKSPQQMWREAGEPE